MPTRPPICPLLLVASAARLCAWVQYASLESCVGLSFALFVLHTRALAAVLAAVPIIFSSPVGLSDLVPSIEVDPIDEPDDDLGEVDDFEDEEITS